MMLQIIATLLVLFYSYTTNTTYTPGQSQQHLRLTSYDKVTGNKSTLNN